MEKMKKVLRKILIVMVLILTTIVIFDKVQAEGINGTVIVLNPRAWRERYRCYQLHKKII